MPALPGEGRWQRPQPPRIRRPRGASNRRHRRPPIGPRRLHPSPSPRSKGACFPDFCDRLDQRPNPNPRRWKIRKASRRNGKLSSRHRKTRDFSPASSTASATKTWIGARPTGIPSTMCSATLRAAASRVRWTRPAGARRVSPNAGPTRSKPAAAVPGDRARGWRPGYEAVSGSEPVDFLGHPVGVGVGRDGQFDLPRITAADRHGDRDAARVAFA